VLFVALPVVEGSAAGIFITLLLALCETISNIRRYEVALPVVFGAVIGAQVVAKHCVREIGRPESRPVSAVLVGLARAEGRGLVSGCVTRPEQFVDLFVSSDAVDVAFIAPDVNYRTVRFVRLDKLMALPHPSDTPVDNTAAAAECVYYAALADDLDWIGYRHFGLRCR